MEVRGSKPSAPIQFAVRSLVDSAHATLAEEFDDLVAVGQDGPDFEQDRGGDGGVRTAWRRAAAKGNRGGKGPECGRCGRNRTASSGTKREDGGSVVVPWPTAAHDGGARITPRSHAGRGRIWTGQRRGRGDHRLLRIEHGCGRMGRIGRYRAARRFRSQRARTSRDTGSSGTRAFSLPDGMSSIMSLHKCWEVECPA
jgi:hypothetical protein